MKKSFSFCDLCKNEESPFFLYRGLEEICGDCKELMNDFKDSRFSLLELRKTYKMYKWFYMILGLLIGTLFGAFILTVFGK